MRRIFAALLLVTMFVNGVPASTFADEGTPVPMAPVLLEPADDAIVPAQPVFVWSVPDGLSTSRIEIATDPAFTAILVTEAIASTTFTPVTPLEPGAMLYWRVWLIPDSGEPSVSDVRSLSVEVEPTVTISPSETPISSPEPTQPESTATIQEPTETTATTQPTEPSATTQPTASPTVFATDGPTSTPTRKPEPTPVMRSEISGAYDSPGYHLTGVGRSANSVHPRVLVDGDLDTIWTSPANHPSSAYVVLALDSVQPIGDIRWVLGKTGRADHIRISISRDRATWTEVGRFRNSEVGKWQRVTVDRSARYIRFLLINTRGDRWLGGLVEIEALPPVAKPEPTATKTPVMPTPIADGIVRNASFESSSSAWYLESGTRISSTAPRGGTRALAVTRTGGFADQQVVLQPGKSYELSAWGYLTRPYDVGLIGIVYRDPSGKRLWDLEPEPLEFTATRFASGVLEFRVPAGVAKASVFIWKEEGGAGFFVDDVRIRTIPDLIEGPASGEGETCQQLLVPGYFDPRTTSLWDTTTQTGTGVGLVIVNPNSGVNDEYDRVWTEVVQSSRSAGFTVLGYVQTDFGDRSSASVIAEMDQYRSWYGIQDFFLDEADTTYGSVERYRAMARNIHQHGGIAVLNFGWMPHHAYMEFTDIAGVFEASYALYGDAYERPAWFYNYPPSRFLHIVHSTPTNKWQTVIERSRLRNAGYVWVTDDNTVSYYKSLPSFWSKLNQTVEVSC